MLYGFMFNKLVLIVKSEEKSLKEALEPSRIHLYYFFRSQYNRFLFFFRNIGYLVSEGTFLEGHLYSLVIFAF